MGLRLNYLIKKTQEEQVKPQVNLNRPVYMQPEDSILYRASRIAIICGMLNTKRGLSKEVISCVDFLLRNTGYQKKFILEYFKGNANIINKVGEYSRSSIVDTDINIVQYKSVPWDLRFNDMFLYLYVRNIIKIIGKSPNVRIILTENGFDYFNKIKGIFVDEVNFLEIFGKTMDEAKTKKIITEVIPKTYWRENEEFIY